ncbi:hypothetical protein [Streptomyces sp. CA-106131]|uniref:hypothetical protein n=1 Tax=Streptomyces sp. CA-106131 TaxID=3240045 RepID=UPI003D8B0BEF
MKAGAAASDGERIAVGLVAAIPTIATAVGACVLVGAAGIVFLATGNATIQLASDPDCRGRVTALWSTAFIGSPIIGALSDAAGARYALLPGTVARLRAVVIGSRPAGQSR